MSLRSLWKHPLGNLSHEVVVFGKKLPKWNALLPNKLQRKWGWLNPVYVAWHILTINVWNETNMSHLNVDHTNCDRVVAGLQYFVSAKRGCRVENNESPTKAGKRFWNLSKLKSGVWPAPTQAWKQYIFLFWSCEPIAWHNESDTFRSATRNRPFLKHL